MNVIAKLYSFILNSSNEESQDSERLNDLPVSHSQRQSWDLNLGLLTPGLVHYPWGRRIEVCQRGPWNSPFPSNMSAWLSRTRQGNIPPGQRTLVLGRPSLTASLLMHMVFFDADDLCTLDA